jgi:hypothetical protein
MLMNMPVPSLDGGLEYRVVKCYICFARNENKPGSCRMFSYPDMLKLSIYR